MTNGLASSPYQHAVTFYEHDLEIVDEVARFAAEGLHDQGRVVLVVTPGHRAGIVQALSARGLDPATPAVARRLLVLDARETLETFMTREGPDPDLFLAHVGRRVLDAGAHGAPVRVFGEMVGLLWEAGDVAAAIALEAMWNSLADRLEFELLCGYPSALVEAGDLTALHDVCVQHSHVHVPASYTATAHADGTSTRVFLPVPEAVASSRRFVVSALRRLDTDHLVDDAAVIVSELATNAVLHAGSPFRVTVDEAVGVVCLSVRDAGDGLATQPLTDAGEHALDGRGIAIIEALSRRWGCDSLRDGKVVWAELAV